MNVFITIHVYILEPSKYLMMIRVSMQNILFGRLVSMMHRFVLFFNFRWIFNGLNSIGLFFVFFSTKSE